jgi:hypothetical protein
VISYLGVAADHRLPFAGDVHRENAGHVIKAQVVDACGPMVDGVVVDSRGISVAIAPSCEVWYGTRDAFFPEARVSVPLEVLSAAAVKAVKIGFGSRGGRLMDAAERVEACVDRLTGAGVQRFVLEPYFDGSNATEEIGRCLRRLSSIPGVAFLKLDFVGGDRLKIYADACSIPWLVRSSGLDFGSFVARLHSAMPFGCAGTMVGTAVWGDLPWLTDSDGARSQLQRRLQILRHIVS